MTAALTSSSNIETFQFSAGQSVSDDVFPAVDCSTDANGPATHKKTKIRWNGWSRRIDHMRTSSMQYEVMNQGPTSSMN